MSRSQALLLLVLFSWSLPAWTQLSDEDVAIDYLLDILEKDYTKLCEVEVRLDEVFDVFGGLVKKRRTEVAGGFEQSTQRAPAITSVITAQDIEVMGARTLDEVLQSVPGLQVSYTWSNNPVYILRGIATRTNPEVLILVNGVRINTSNTGGKSADGWAGFPVSAIARIEIMRGPGSALYGADAFAGVVNILTKRDIHGSEFGFRIGNHNTRDAWVVHGSEWQDFAITAMADFSTTDGHQRKVASDAQSVWDQVYGSDASLAPGPYGSEITTYDARLEVAKAYWLFRAGMHRGEDMGAGTGIGQALDPHRPLKLRERINLDLTWHNPTVSQHWGWEAQAAYVHHDAETEYQIFPPGAFGGAYPIGYLGRPASAEYYLQLGFAGLYRGLQNHVMRLGGGYANYDQYQIGDHRNFGTNPFTGEPASPTEMLDVTDTAGAFIPETARDAWYGFVQDTWTFRPDWELTAGVRYDHYSDFGATTNPRLGLVWEAQSGLVVKLLYGRAFRAPSFQELYNANNPIAIGNPDLKPETLSTWELAFDYRATPALNMVLNLFRYKIRDKITLVPMAGGVNYSFANAATWKGQGGEFELRWKTGAKSSLLFNYSYQDSADEPDLYRGSRQVVYLRGDYLLGTRWYLDTQLNWNNGRQRETRDTRPALDGYSTVDVIVRRKATRAGKTNFALGVRNLFDSDVRYPSPGPDTGSTVVNVPDDLPGAGRFYFVEFRYKF